MRAETPLQETSLEAPGPLPLLSDDQRTTFTQALLAQASVRGAIRVTNAGITSARDLQRVAQSAGIALEHFAEESSPRSSLLDGVASATTYPSKYPIQMHNEFSYASEWPRYLLFACLVQPESGGETPTADARRILDRLSPSTRSEFEHRGLLYERNYSRRSGVTWQRAFSTAEHEDVERHCDRAGLSVQWGPDDQLTTRQQAAAIARHPLTGDAVWFNHCLLFNVRGLEPPWLRSSFLRQPPAARASNSYWGDGAEISDEIFDEVRSTTDAERVAAPWAAGDLLAIDNMLAAHGRAPYTGVREVVVAMVGRWTRQDVSTMTQARQ